MSDKKEELSSHVENIFKQYVHPGLYICEGTEKVPSWVMLV